jgi:hypothetical protein
VEQGLLENVRVTADRVKRFGSDVEEEPSAERKARWRAALEDLRDAIRRARAAGADTEEIQEAAQGLPTTRFQRAGAEDAAPERAVQRR